MQKKLIRFATICGLTLTVQQGFAQGSLTPPAGPPAPTMKTLQQIEPRTDVLTLSGDTQSVVRITKPGAYYLTTNIAGLAGKHGIVIASDNVSLDLNGFSVVGVSGSLSGVVAAGFGITNPIFGGFFTNYYANISVLNGTVSGWGSAGVDCAFSRNAQFKICGLKTTSGPGFHASLAQSSTVSRRRMVAAEFVARWV